MNSPGPMDAPDPTSISGRTGPRRFRIGIRHGLLASFGSLVMLAVLAVLGLGLWSARQSTLELLSQIAAGTRSVVLTRIDEHLQPIEVALRHLGHQMQDGSVDAADANTVLSLLSGSLAAVPQVRSFALAREDGTLHFAVRRDNGVTTNTVDAAGQPIVRDAIAGARRAVDVYWSDLIFPESAGRTLLNARYPVRFSDGGIAVLAATVQIDALSKVIEASANSLGGRAFIVYDGRSVLAHRALVEPFPGLGPSHLLPGIDEIGDPLVTAALHAPLDRQDARIAGETGLRLVEANDSRWAVVAAGLDRYGARPWQVVVALPAAGIDAELLRLRFALVAGLVVLVLAIVVAMYVARLLSAPVNRLSDAARSLENLRLADVPHLPPSLFREIDSAATAFNAMVAGLSWFERYLPRRLVERLMHMGEGHVAQSTSRDVTVMFTDIVEFTRRSSTMTAEQTASFLNEHFSVVAGCIEAEDGTIDKFIGDSVMAFWNAPDDQPDHAARACRTALAIRAAIRYANTELAARGAPVVHVRIGIATGPVVVGNIGTAGRINYTIVGETVNTANRLEQLGKTLQADVNGQDAGNGAGVTIVASTATFEACNPPVPGRRLRGQALRGIDHPVDVILL
jgi:adenylate cyclase